MYIIIIYQDIDGKTIKWTEQPLRSVIKGHHYVCTVCKLTVGGATRIIQTWYNNRRQKYNNLVKAKGAQPHTVPRAVESPRKSPPRMPVTGASQKSRKQVTQIIASGGGSDKTSKTTTPSQKKKSSKKRPLKSVASNASQRKKQKRTTTQSESSDTTPTKEWSGADASSAGGFDDADGEDSPPPSTPASGSDVEEDVAGNGSDEDDNSEDDVWHWVEGTLMTVQVKSEFVGSCIMVDSRVDVSEFAEIEEETGGGWYLITPTARV